MRYRLQRHDGTDCSATMVPITVLRMVPIQRYRQLNGTPKVYEFEFNECMLENKELSVKRFDEYTEEWAEFIFANRKNLSAQNIHNYDIVIGPIANDKVGAQIRNYVEGNISFELFMERLKYMKGITFQYFFGTEKAIKYLTNI